MKPNVTKKQNESQRNDIDLVQRILDDMFILLSFDKQACDRIGLTKITPVIGKMPGWYLWTKDRKGAYYLRLIDTEPTETKADRTRPSQNKRFAWVVSDFILRYYPSPDEPLFEEYTFVERQVRLGPCFDHTGIPFRPEMMH